MGTTHSIVSKLKQDFPSIRFTVSDGFRWSPSESTVFYRDGEDSALLFHEVAHAALGHHDYHQDIDLLKMERDAWEYAKILAERHGDPIEEETLQDALDTYRDWLHVRSKCPTCASTGVQIEVGEYRCVACTTTWTVNEARSRTLRRSVVSKYRNSR